MLLLLMSAAWLLALVLPLQAGRWYLRRGRAGTGLGVLAAVCAATAALVAVNLLRAP